MAVDGPTLQVLHWNDFKDAVSDQNNAKAMVDSAYAAYFSSQRTQDEHQDAGSRKPSPNGKKGHAYY
ncbi:uncharacterized protein BDCG_09184 [Blastomyces dermatitidis ER-3]|uniref:Uncharacterized protein n=1 Tax=Ajellomyces dermatitidis (strain ER-3 / ATCC MYA-2586) TaxID=559297 RepID=A0ABP2EQN6_AJEDR|nr:uncharacterized protein BDCG_09184 [Blastomyces dermatitidis ER-3]EEQ85915.2 hypothetical protein BDCG_09184 [Blastomyces dermatitidis ER-3]EQL32318.1 hypothetical protein BDFG_05547 [Blastomyces dermatitidis ATCC 26199]